MDAYGNAIDTVMIWKDIQGNAEVEVHFIHNSSEMAFKRDNPCNGYLWLHDSAGDFNEFEKSDRPGALRWTGFVTEKNGQAMALNLINKQD